MYIMSAYWGRAVIRQIVIAFVFFMLTATGVDAEEPQKIKIGYSALRISLPVFVAEKRVYLKKKVWMLNW